MHRTAVKVIGRMLESFLQLSSNATSKASSSGVLRFTMAGSPEAFLVTEPPLHVADRLIGTVAR